MPEFLGNVVVQIGDLDNGLLERYQAYGSDTVRQLDDERVEALVLELDELLGNVTLYGLLNSTAQIPDAVRSGATPLICEALGITDLRDIQHILVSPDAPKALLAVMVFIDMLLFGLGSGIGLAINWGTSRNTPNTIRGIDLRRSISWIEEDKA